MLAGVFRDSRLGIPALGLLVVGFCADFAVNGRKDMYCFAPPADNWAYHVGQVAFLAMVAGGVIAIVGMRRDRENHFAIITLASWIPLVFVDALRMGCW